MTNYKDYCDRTLVFEETTKTLHELNNLSTCMNGGCVQINIPISHAHAAAPDLLRACKAAQRQLWGRRLKFSDNDHGAMNLLSAAIAKAEGRG